MNTTNIHPIGGGLVVIVRGDVIFQNKLTMSEVGILLKLKCVYTRRKAKLGNFRGWSLTSLAQNRLTIHQQFCLSEVKQPLAKIATCCSLLQVANDVTFWLFRVAPASMHLRSKTYFQHSFMHNLIYMKIRRTRRNSAQVCFTRLEDIFNSHIGKDFV